MPHYAYIVKALDSQDDGWVRLGGYFPTKESAWQFVELFSTLEALRSDYVTINVECTIVFGPFSFT